MSVADAYVRVSSKSQDLDTQVHAISKAAAARGDKIGKWYSEKASGANTARFVLASVCQKVRQGEIRKLYVYRLDRLSRGGILDTLTKLEELRNNGCDVVSVADPFDLHGPTAPLLIALTAWVAEVERLSICERLADARKRVEENGGRWGRPRRMTSSEIARAVALRGNGHTVRYISQVLRVPRATVQRMLAQKPPLKVLAKTSGR